jgi:hypothetical protein
VCLYVCDQETPKREAKGPSWTIRACELMNIGGTRPELDRQVKVATWERDETFTDRCLSITLVR